MNICYLGYFSTFFQTEKSYVEQEDIDQNGWNFGGALFRYEESLRKKKLGNNQYLGTQFEFRKIAKLS